MAALSSSLKPLYVIILLPFTTPQAEEHSSKMKKRILELSLDIIFTVESPATSGSLYLGLVSGMDGLTRVMVVFLLSSLLCVWEVVAVQHQMAGFPWLDSPSSV